MPQRRSLGGNSSVSDAVSNLLNSFLGGGVSSISGLTGSNTGFLSDKALDIDEIADYLMNNLFVGENLVWDTDSETPVLRLSEEQCPSGRNNPGYLSFY